MHNLSIERRKVGSTGSLPEDIAHQLRTRPASGKVCIVTDRPKDMVTLVKKQCRKIVRLQQLRFVANPDDDFTGTDIGFVTPAQALGYAPECRTMYIVCNVQKDKLHFMTAMMPPGGTVVIYDAN